MSATIRSSCNFGRNVSSLAIKVDGMDRLSMRTIRQRQEEDNATSEEGGVQRVGGVVVVVDNDPPLADKGLENKGRSRKGVRL